MHWANIESAIIGLKRMLHQTIIEILHHCGHIKLMMSLTVTLSHHHNAHAVKTPVVLSPCCYSQPSCVCIMMIWLSTLSDIISLMEPQWSHVANIVWWSMGFSLVMDKTICLTFIWSSTPDMMWWIWTNIKHRLPAAKHCFWRCLHIYDTGKYTIYQMDLEIATYCLWTYLLYIYRSRFLPSICGMIAIIAHRNMSGNRIIWRIIRLD